MIQISQSPYIERVLTGKEWLNLNCIGSPLDTHMKYNLDLPELDEKEKNEYLELVGSAQWISNNTRPDVAYAANFLGIDWPRSSPVPKFQDWTEFLWFSPVQSGKKSDWTRLHQKDCTV
jgi:hypothetical protein